MSQVIERALEHVSKPTGSKEELDEEVGRLQHLRANLLPVEREALRQVDRELEKVATKLAALAYDLPNLDPVVFGWRKRETLRCGMLGMPIPLPSLAVIDIKSRSAEMRISAEGVNVDGSLRLDAYYTDVINELRNEGRRKNKKLSIRSGYTGMIPDSTKAKIKEHAHKFDSVVLMNEAQWTLVVDPVPIRIDPLVLGMKNGLFYLIDVFDPTSVEDYIAKEFAR